MSCSTRGLLPVPALLQTWAPAVPGTVCLMLRREKTPINQGTWVKSHPWQDPAWQTAVSLGPALKGPCPKCPLRH